MQDLRSLFNQALTAIGHSAVVTDPNSGDTPTSMCRLWFDPARREVMTAYHWSSVRAVSRLARVAERTGEEWQPGDPEPGFAYAHALPNNCLQPQFLSSFARFHLGRLAGANVVFSNTPHPVLHYTIDCTDPSRWDANLYSCVLFNLAANLNMSFSGKYPLTQALGQKVYELLVEAQVSDANSDDSYFENIPTSHRGTGFDVMANSPTYIYPTQTFRVAGVSA